MRVFRSKDKLIIPASNDTYHNRDVIRAIGNYRYDRIHQFWEFPLNKVTAILDLLNVQATPEVKDLYKEYKTKEEERKRKIGYIQSLYTKDLKDIYPGLYRHQKIALEAAKQFESYCLFLETGCGKTLVAIELIKYRKVPTLVVAPLSILEAVWVEEIEKFAPELKVINLWNHPDGIQKEADIYVINYEKFKKLKDIENKVKFLIIDESSKLKDPTTQITKAVLAYKDKIPYRLVMSGTPAPNSTLEFWAQVCFINPELLGDNFYRFRNTYFYSYGYGNYQWSISKENREKIMTKIKEQAIFFSKADALDLPEQIFEKRYVEMESAQQKVYQDMFSENIAYFKDKVSISSTELTKLMKLREITSGFFFDDNGKAVTISEKKLDVLMEVLEDIGDHQVTIFCNFKWEVEKIKHRLGERAVILSGEVSQREKDKNIEMFKDDVVQYLIANVASAGHGLNLQNCNYVVYFSLSYSNELHKQSQDRFHRQGQINKVTYFYLLMKESIDELLYKVLVKKANLLESCMELLKGEQNANYL